MGARGGFLIENIIVEKEIKLVGKLSPELVNNLREQLSMTIAAFKAYDVPNVCERIGLATGTEAEAFQSKYRYAHTRVTSLSSENLVNCAKRLYADEKCFHLGEILAKIEDLNGQPITKLTRRRLIKLFDAHSLVTEVEDIEFIRSILPLNLIPAPAGMSEENLEEFLYRHTVSFDDMTQKEVLESLGLLECSTKLLFKFLVGLTSAEFQTHERQIELADAIDGLLVHDGYRLVEKGRVSGSPVFRVQKCQQGSPSDYQISKAIKDFEPSQISPRWQAALECRSSDPERAITLARTLLEDVCKWIMNKAGEEWMETDDLPTLYKKTSKVLNLAPDGHSELIFKQILSGCQSVVFALGALRNKLGDAHSIGPNRARPAARHAELAVNLAGNMATFLIATWEAKSIKPK